MPQCCISNCHPYYNTLICLSMACLAGYDQFMNIVLDNTVEIVSPTEKNEIGMVVIRGLMTAIKSVESVVSPRACFCSPAVLSRSLDVTA